MSKAYQLDALKRIGLDISGLGCVMLDVAMPDLSVVDERWEYYSPSKQHWWVSGVQDEGHATLLYGLLPDLVDRQGVDEVLTGWEPPVLEASGLEVFGSPFPDEPYACIVARVAHPALLDAHQRLSLLPHINTYPDYKAHVTLTYVHQTDEQDALDELERLLPIKFDPSGLNYGKAIGGQ